AMAIDRGIALPSFLVPDVPASWGTWSPSNYDGNFDGLVRLDDALSRSLNLPYISLLQRIGVEEFLGTLRQMGVRSFGTDPGRYGLSAAVGGVELTALEIAGLYASLAEDGRWKPLVFEVGAEPATARPVLSEGSTWLTRKTLSQRDRPDFPRRRELHSTPDIHWKTGTSSGRRDAWAVGSGPEHTVAVWVGNLDNRGRAQLQGSETAGPLLFDVLSALRDRTAPSPVDPVPSELRRIDVCAYSGHPATEACPRRTSEFARYEAVPTEACPFHTERQVQIATGLAVRPGCGDPELETESRTFVVWPASVRRFVRNRHRHLPEPPTWADGCAAPQRDVAPRILTPPADHVALLIPGMPVDRQQIPLEAEAAGDTELSWFVNGAFLGTVAATERLWWTPEAGIHEVVVTDERGRLSKRDLEVRKGR
ncbi:MAG: penicillin-binding protein 1C, partial [Deltaproteobacteria bacterium]|nr:penicillin-binding protein 1C [Deltaproteobacteria bacterium]